MKDNLNQYIVVIIWLVSSKESQCQYHQLWRNVAFADFGASYKTYCDATRLPAVPDIVSVFQVELFWNGVGVYRYQEGVQDQRQRAETWEVEVTGMKSNESRENNRNTYNVTIRFPSLTLEDQGSLLCRIFYHDRSILKNVSIYEEILFLFVKEPSEKALCEKDSFYYRKREVCIKLIQRDEKWPDARDYCRRVENGRLAVTKSKAYELFVAGLILKHGIHPHWIGSYENKIRKSQWIDEDVNGTNVMFPRQFCGSIDPAKASDRISYRPCTEANYFVCEKVALKEPRVFHDANVGAIAVAFMVMTILVLVTVCALMALPQDICIKLTDEEEYMGHYRRAESTDKNSSVSHVSKYCSLNGSE